MKLTKLYKNNHDFWWMQTEEGEMLGGFMEESIARLVNSEATTPEQKEAYERILQIISEISSNVTEITDAKILDGSIPVPDEIKEGYENVEEATEQEGEATPESEEPEEEGEEAEEESDEVEDAGEEEVGEQEEEDEEEVEEEDEEEVEEEEDEEEVS